MDVISIDGWSRERSEGYTMLSIPITPGIHQHKLSCYRELAENRFMDKLTRYFIGGRRIVDHKTFNGISMTEKVKYVLRDRPLMMFTKYLIFLNLYPSSAHFKMLAMLVCHVWHDLPTDPLISDLNVMNIINGRFLNITLNLYTTIMELYSGVETEPIRQRVNIHWLFVC